MQRCAFRWLVAAVCAVCFMAGCGVGAEKPAIEQAMKNDKLRGDSFEATLRVLDKHPEYVDQLFAATLKHEPTLRRFLLDASKALEREDVSRMNAEYLARYPRSLRQIEIATLDAVSDKPESQKGIAEAMHERPQGAAMVLVQREDALRATFHALIAEVQKNAYGRRAFVTAMAENADALAALVADNPKVLHALLQAFVAVEAKKGGAKIKSLGKKLGDSVAAPE